MVVEAIAAPELCHCFLDLVVVVAELEQSQAQVFVEYMKVYLWRSQVPPAEHVVAMPLEADIVTTALPTCQVDGGTLTEEGVRQNDLMNCWTTMNQREHGLRSCRCLEPPPFFKEMARVHALSTQLPLGLAKNDFEVLCTPHGGQQGLAWTCHCASGADCMELAKRSSYLAACRLQVLEGNVAFRDARGHVSEAVAAVHLCHLDDASVALLQPAHGSSAAPRPLFFRDSEVREHALHRLQLCHDPRLGNDVGTSSKLAQVGEL
mmetsp:Transcript_11028/g.45018  ORF Transcript_11028/g.45018 Transcript_11028/m.45018 type:complete len:263 (-) Transcript_11028:483-1271(-)